MKNLFFRRLSRKCKTVLTKSNFQFLPEIIFPSANEMSELSFQKFIAKEFEDVAYFEPFYQRFFIDQIVISLQQMDKCNTSVIKSF
jgi:tRNA threonylcarbamoyladenosine biosynthesis protein TsaB